MVVPEREKEGEKKKKGQIVYFIGIEMARKKEKKGKKMAYLGCPLKRGQKKRRGSKIYHA